MSDRRDDRSSKSGRVLTFSVGEQTLAIDAAAVAEVLPTPRLTRVPHARQALAGIANVRGRVVPILSVDVLLGAQTPSSGSRVILLDGAEPLGLAVDQVTALEAATDEATQLLDLERLLAEVSLSTATRSHRAEAPLAARLDPPKVAAEIAFLEFQLAGQAYGIPLEQVREVAPVPDSLTVLPGTDDAMLGVIEHRGDLLALISLHAVLGLPVSPEGRDARVVVVSIADGAVALLVERVTGVLRAGQQDLGPAPAVLNRGAGEARIDAIVRRAGGLVSVLAVEQILDEATIAQLIADSAGPAAPAPAAEPAAVEQVVIFRLGSETYGLPIASVLEVRRLPRRLAQAPRTPEFVVGLMNHRGEPVPLIDQASRFVSPQAAEVGVRQVLIVQADELMAGVVVDGVESVVSVPAADLRPTPPAADNLVLDRVASLDADGRLVMLVDPRQLLAGAGRDIAEELAARPKREVA
ncbi:chemotaxis protein CheW [Phenylobacterium sp.]|jgi:purine-binding chemotaxis protein CheW|uniref:chemotaxis protein CheW n=1 Tax=Phenylobacterium sp. TaxID=1871053 RepID=UPI00378319D5